MTVDEFQVNLCKKARERLATGINESIVWVVENPKPAKMVGPTVKKLERERLSLQKLVAACDRSGD